MMCECLNRDFDKIKKIYMRRFYFALVLISLFCNILNARLISGKVTSYENGEPAIGASIIIKGTNIGTITDLDGHYQIGVDDLHAVLKFLYIGYQSQEITIGKDSIINVTLKKENVALGEFILKAHVKLGKPIWGISDTIIRQDTIVKKFGSKIINRHIFIKGPSIIGKGKTIILGIEKQWNCADWLKNIFDNMNYPDSAIYNGIQGRVLVCFKIDLNGNIKDIKIMRGLDNCINQNVLSVIQAASPAPHIQLENFEEPKNFDVPFILPIVFRIEYE